MRLQPCIADTRIGHERYRQGIRLFHLFHDERLEGVEFGTLDVKD